MAADSGDSAATSGGENSPLQRKGFALPRFEKEKERGCSWDKNFYSWFSSASCLNFGRPVLTFTVFYSLSEMFRGFFCGGKGGCVDRVEEFHLSILVVRANRNHETFSPLQTLRRKQ
jgi:hypothetical protein